MKTSAYLVLRAEKWNGTITGFKVVRAVQKYPALKSNEAVVKVTLEAPTSIFDAAAVAIVVEPSDVMLAVEVGAPEEE